MDEADLCAICNSPGRNFHAKEKKLRQIQKHKAFHAGRPPPARKSARIEEKIPEPNENFSLEDDLPAHQQLQAQLRVIFLLQEIFKHPVNDATTLETMQVVGNPSKWFEICEKCSSLVDTGIEVLRKLKKYEREHQRITDILEKKLMASKNAHHLTDIKNYSSMEPTEDEDLEVSRARVEFRNKIRKTDATFINREIEIDIKYEPENFTDYENDSFDCGFEDHVLSPAEGPSKPARKTTKQTDVKIEEGENTKRGGYSKRTMKAIKKSKVYKKPKKTGKKIVKKVEKKKSGRKKSKKKRSFFTYEDIDVEPEIPDEDDPQEDPDFSCSEEEDAEMDEEELKWREKYFPEKKPASENEGEKTQNERRERDPSWFFDKCPEYLDMTLIDYSPLITTKDNVAGTTEGTPGTFKAIRYPCPSCEKTFCNKFYTIAHIHRTHLGVDKPWRCNMCSHKSRISRKFRGHIRDHISGILKTCPICNTYSSRQQRTFDSHLINHQRRTSTPTCYICQSSFTSFKIYVKHMTDQHQLLYSQKEVWIGMESPCELCTKVLPNRKRLNYHLLKEHQVGDNDGTFPLCPECGEILFDQQAVSSHQTNRHPREENICFCEQCGKECKTAVILKAHMAMVHIEEPQNCKLCGMELQNARKLDGHMKAAHKETKAMSLQELEEYVRRKNEEKNYHCRLCGGAFAFNVQLYHHYRSSHPEVTEKYKCDICGKGFSRQSSVKRHVEVNHMKLKITCEDCGKVFTKGDSLGQHRRYHCMVKKKKEWEQAAKISGEPKQEATPVTNDGNLLNNFL